jgi:hypothetical protein
MSTPILAYFNSHGYYAYQQEYIIISTAATENEQVNYIFMFICGNIKNAWSYTSTSTHPDGTKPCTNISKPVCFFLIFLPPLISA